MERNKSSGVEIEKKKQNRMKSDKFMGVVER